MGTIAIVERLSNLCTFELPIAGGTRLAVEAEEGSEAERIIAESIKKTIITSGVIGISTAAVSGTVGFIIANLMASSSTMDSDYGGAEFL